MNESEIGGITLYTIKQFTKEALMSSGLSDRGVWTAFCMLSAEYLGHALSDMDKDLWDTTIDTIVHDGIVHAKRDKGEK